MIPMMPMTLTQYLDIDQRAVQATREGLSDLIQTLDELAAFFGQIERAVIDTQQATVDDRFVELCLFHDARRFWLSGCATWARQHLTECFPAMRAALEAAAYARKISLNPDLNQVWLHRDQQKTLSRSVPRWGHRATTFPRRGSSCQEVVVACRHRRYVRCARQS